MGTVRLLPSMVAAAFVLAVPAPSPAEQIVTQRDVIDAVRKQLAEWMRQPQGQPMPAGLHPFTLPNQVIAGVRLMHLAATTPWEDGGMAPATPARLMAAPSMVALATRACVKVITPNWHGAGFFVSSDGFVLTAYHVVAGAPFASVQMSSGRILTITNVVAYSVTHDLALLKTEGGPFPMVDVSRSISDETEPLIGIGHPEGASWTAYAARPLREEQVGVRRLLAFEADIGPGNSGGAMFNSRGEFAGMAAYSAVFPNGARAKLAVTPATIRAFLAKPTGHAISFDDLSSMQHEVSVPHPSKKRTSKPAVASRGRSAARRKPTRS